MSGNGACWKIEGDEALLECGPLHARIDLAHLYHGLRELTWKIRRQDRHLSVHPLMLCCGDDYPGCRRIETYIRGNDLVANYESDSPQGTPQVYWRIKPEAGNSAIGIEVILSKTTPLLNSEPASFVDCLGTSLWHAAALDNHAFSPIQASDTPMEIDGINSRIHLFLLRDEHLQISYLQVVHPTDFVSAQITDHLAKVVEKPQREALYVRSRLLPEPLEKGVIRRARIGGWFLPTENDLAVAVELARQFIDEPLPLTT